MDRGRGGSLPMAGAGPLSDISFKVLTIIIINIVNIITKIQTNKTWLDHYQTSDYHLDQGGPGPIYGKQFVRYAEGPQISCGI